MGKTHVTIHDMARELNNSASTVSRALHDHPRISEATRNAVRALADKYHYQPNVVASSLRQGKSLTVGVVVPRINRNFFSNVIGGLEEQLASSGYHLMICQSHEKLENEVGALKTLVHARVDAIMLSVSMETRSHQHLSELEQKGIRLYFFDRIIEEMKTGAVLVDDRLGAYQMVKHMLEQGYRKIMHLSGPAHINIYRARRQGYLEAMQEAGIEVPPGWVMEKALVLQGGAEALAQVQEAKADAIFCAGDYAALGLMQEARRQGLEIPSDLGISGFGNEPFTAFLSPGLSTVDQRGAQMGRLLADMFLDGKDHPITHQEVERKILKPQCITRESTRFQIP